MSYVVYETATTKLVSTKAYKTMAAARAARTRKINKEYARTGCPLLDSAYAVAGTADYYANIERQVPVVNMMSGKTVMESVNTPNFMSVGSEAYWSA